jgi:formylglycine-generating enzyme required for sulfatase activity
MFVAWASVLLLWSGCSPVAAAQISGAASSHPAVAHPDGGGPTSSKTCPSTMLFIRAGSFRMGSKDAKNYEFQVEGNPIGLSEEPVHKVTLPAFCMDRTEVTVASYRTCVTAGACSPPDSKDKKCNWSQPANLDHPIDCVNWSQAGAYCTWKEAALPSEEQWEYAARGTDGRRYPWGNRKPEWKFVGRAWQVPEACADEMQSHTCPVESHPLGKSPFGVLNLSDDVGEWTESRDCDYGTDRCSTGRVVRGELPGSFFRAASRESSVESTAWPLLGFRCVARPW